MSQDKTILIVGTYDTKDDELGYLANVIRAQGGQVATMDVSVLGEPSQPTDYSKHDVAQAAGSTIAAAIAAGDENVAMQIMADGASTLALKLYRAGKFDGVIVLELCLQILPEPSCGRCSWCGAGCGAAEMGQAADWNDLFWQNRAALYGGAQASIGRARL